MNFYLILRVRSIWDWSDNARSRCRIIHVFQSPDKKSYDIYIPKLWSYEETLFIFNWPRKKMSRSFIEKVFKYRKYLTSIDSDSIEELIDKVNALCGDITNTNNNIITIK